MIIGKTLFPELVEIFAIGDSVEYIKKYTNMCQVAEQFPREFDLMYKWKRLINSKDQLNDLRDFVKEFVIVGPELDVPTILFYVNKINNSISKEVSEVVKTEIEISFVKAQNITYIGTTNISYNRNIPIDEDNDFLNMLAQALRNCNGPCNYLAGMSDSMGTMTNHMEVPSNNSTPLWDVLHDLFQDPIGMSMGTFNKIIPEVRTSAIQLKQGAENLFRNGLAPFFSEKRIKEEKAMLKSGKSITSIANSYVMQPDTTTYFKKGMAASQALGQLRARMGDCFRIFEFQKRYNPQDKMMNLGIPRRYTYRVNTNGYVNVIDMFGRVILDSEIKQTYNKLSTQSITPAAYECSDDYSVSKNYNFPPSNYTNDSANKSLNTDNGKPKITHYGYPTDKYDGNSEYGRGNHNNQLIPWNNATMDNPVLAPDGSPYLPSVAVTPDIESQLRSQGARPGDYFQFKDVNGSNYQVQWADVTSQSLSGRIDVYNPLNAGALPDSPNLNTIQKIKPPGNLPTNIPWKEAPSYSAIGQLNAKATASQ